MIFNNSRRPRILRWTCRQSSGVLSPFVSRRNVQQIVATGGAFAACLAENGQVVTWGDGDFGGGAQRREGWRWLLGISYDDGDAVEEG